MHSISALVALTAMFAPSMVSAHGYVSSVSAIGKNYEGTSPFRNDPRPGWHAMNTDIGFVSVHEYHDHNIACHKQATPGKQYVRAQAGGQVQLHWTPWNEGHRGPVLTYLARCHSGDCTRERPEDLDFFLIDSKGLIRPSQHSGDKGYWASNQLADNGNSWTVNIPKGLSGNFVLRHEIIALHSAMDQRGSHGAQNYPNCINLQIAGPQNVDPCSSGADCRKGAQLYQASDPGILINIYYPKPTRYSIPGPKKWVGLR